MSHTTALCAQPAQPAAVLCCVLLGADASYALDTWSLTVVVFAHAQEILIALDWEVFGVLRRAGFNCTTCPEGEAPPEMC